MADEPVEHGVESGYLIDTDVRHLQHGSNCVHGRDGKPSLFNGGEIWLSDAISVSATSRGIDRIGCSNINSEKSGDCLSACFRFPEPPDCLWAISRAGMTAEERRCAG